MRARTFRNVGSTFDSGHEGSPGRKFPVFEHKFHFRRSGIGRFLLSFTTVNKPVTQDRFLECYRGGQGRWNHMAYLRLCKVFVILEAIRRNGHVLAGSRIFDYAFGAGTFFRHCPRTAQLFGVELDAATVGEVTLALQSDGFSQMDLDVIALDSWQKHRLLQSQYDLVVCSHVLEHLDEPSLLLSCLRRCLSEKGRIVAIVPINEIRQNPHHVQVVDRERIEAWASTAELKVEDYFECDSVGWIIQPLLASNKGVVHKLARLASLATGLPFAFLGLASWRLVNLMLRSVRIPASQACIVLK